MTVRLHPDADLLVDYSAGSLSPAICASISAHLHFCDTCRVEEKQLAEIGGDLLDKVEPATMDDNAFEAVLSQLDSLQGETIAVSTSISSEGAVSDEMSKLPAFIQNLVKEPQYAFLTRSLKVAKLPIGEDKYELALHKIRPGGQTPKHDHNGLEVTVVLYGSFSDIDGVYNEGDFIIRKPGDIHSPLASADDECICLSVVEAPIRLVGPLLRVINPFLSFNPA